MALAQLTRRLGHKNAVLPVGGPAVPALIRGRRFVATQYPENEDEAHAKTFAVPGTVPLISAEEYNESKEWLRSIGGEGEVRLELPDDAADPSASDSGLGAVSPAIITLDNPKARNAMSGVMMSQFSDIVDKLEKWDQGMAVILRGAGKEAFSAGSDLRAAREHLAAPSEGLRMCRFMQSLLTRFRRLPLISVAAIDAPAVGGGSELALTPDHRIMASEHAIIRSVHAKIGTCPGWGGGSRFVSVLGRQRALLALGSCRPINAQEALAWGLCDEIAPPGEAVSHARGFLAANYFDGGGAVAAIRGIKRMVAAADELEHERALAVERDTFASLWGGPANLAALAASGKKKK
eukprot:Clim_evm106s134 gene=Clim_evmTU106s134